MAYTTTNWWAMPISIEILVYYFRWFSFSDWCQLIPDDHHAKTLIMASAEAVREVETASMNDIIDLNVGGTKFQTTRYLWPIKNFNGQCSLLLCPGRRCCTILILCWRECLTPCLPFVQVKSITRNLLLSLFCLGIDGITQLLCLWYPRPHLYLLRSEKRWSVFPWQRSNPF